MFLRVAIGDALSNESIEVVKPVFCRREQFAFGNPFDDSIIYMSILELSMSIFEFAFSLSLKSSSATLLGTGFVSSLYM